MLCLIKQQPEKQGKGDVSRLFLLFSCGPLCAKIRFAAQEKVI